MSEFSRISCHCPELMHHRRCHFLQALGPRELVGIGEEIAFERRGLRRQIRDQLGLGFDNLQKISRRPESRVFHSLGDVEHRIAFGNGDHVEVDIAARDPLINLRKTRRALETILARLQGRLGVQQMPEPESNLASDHPSLFQFRRNAPRRISGMQQQRSIGWGRNWGKDQPSQPAANGEGDNQNQRD